MSENHQTDSVCSCNNCTMIDCLWGDPLLNPWEKSFIESLTRYGWIADYTDKQVTTLRQVWRNIRRLRKIQRSKIE